MFTPRPTIIIASSSKDDGIEIEIDSIGIQHDSGATEYWAWGIDAVIPMREGDAQGTGKDRADCTQRFKAAWERFAADEANLTMLLAEKRRARRTRNPP